MVLTEEGKKTSMEIKVSVVIAVYNSEKYVGKTIESVIAQTLREIEIILVDDGSTDRSLNILNQYAQKDDRIKVFQQKEPSDGAALARNLGVSHASGAYVSILDSDDFFEPDMLKKAYDRAMETESEVVIYDGDLYDEKCDSFRETGMILRKEFLPKEPVFCPADHPDTLFFMTIGAAWSALFKRDLILREKLRFHSFHHADDLGFVYLGFATANRIAVLDERLLHYRCNNTASQAANLEKWPEAAAGSMKELKKALDERGLMDTYRVAFTENALHYFELYLHRMPDYDSFEKLYFAWQTKHVQELELLMVPDDRLVQRRIIKIRHRLMELTPGQYLFDREKGIGLFEADEKWRTIIPEGSKVILYCAGKKGKELFKELAISTEFRLAAWADAKFEDYGYPVISPDKALEQEYDYILVAIESEGIFGKIKKTFISKGVSTDKILWAGSEA